MDGVLDHHDLASDSQCLPILSDKLPMQANLLGHKIFTKYHIPWILRCSFLFHISVFLKW